MRLSCFPAFVLSALSLSVSAQDAPVPAAPAPTPPADAAAPAAEASALLPAVGAIENAEKPAGSPLDKLSGLLNNLTSELDIEGTETDIDVTTGIYTAKGDVHMAYGDTEINADRADYNANTGDVRASGNVTVTKAGTTYQSEAIVYNVKSGDLSGTNLRSSASKMNGTVLYQFGSMNTATRDMDSIQGNEGFFTTSDLKNPNYRVTAKKMTVYPNDRIVLKDVKVYVGNTPIFYLPYMSQPLDGELGYRFAPGYTQTWGAYLLNQYGVVHGDHTLAQYKVDLRSTRGVALGADFFSMKQRGNDEWGKLSFYYAFDNQPLLSQSGENRVDVPSGRYRVNFQHRIYITGPAEKTWYVDFDINKISDSYFYEDYFMQEFRTMREPDNQVSFVRHDPRYTATLMSKFQLNDFYRTDTRLPELALDFTRQPVMSSGVFYQGSTSFGILDEKRGTFENASNRALQAKITANADGSGSLNDLDRQAVERSLGRSLTLDAGRDEVSQALAALGSDLLDTGFNRLHSYHEFLYPVQAMGWLNFVPRVGLGYQSYSSITGGSSRLSSDSRAILQVGFDLSFKMTKTWDDVQNDALGLNGLKHTVQPYINYSYLKADDIEGLPQIDKNVSTTRPRPIDLPFYPGIDSLRNWNVARVGVRNLLQTKRDYSSFLEDDTNQFRVNGETANQTYNWFGLNSYVDVFMDDPEFNRDVSNFYNEIFWRPVPWITFWADTQLPLGNGDYSFTEANYGITYMPTNKTSITLGHQLLSDHPFFQNSSLVYSRLYARVSEQWGVSMNHVYEIDDGTLEYQSYSVHRDLSSWVATLGALVRDNRGQTDFGLIFSMSLKEFPQVSLPLDTDPNPTGRGGKR